MTLPMSTLPATDPSPAVADPQRRATRLAVQVGVPPAVLVGLIGFIIGLLVEGVLVGVVAGVVLLVVCGIGFSAWIRQAGDRRVRAAIGGVAADPAHHARYINLVEGLATSAGIRIPELRVIDQPGLNAMAAGLHPDTGLVVVTSGLLSQLTRIELEAVLAEVLIQIRHGETVPATVLAATSGWGADQVLRPGREVTTDQQAASLTRYPPGLEAALEKLRDCGTTVTGTPPWAAHLWIADPSPGGRSAAKGPGRIPLDERIQAVREL